MQNATNETTESIKRGITKRGLDPIIGYLSMGHYTDTFKKQLIEANILSSDGIPNLSLLYMLASS